MVTEDQKTTILNCVKLGMPLNQAALIAQCSVDDQAVLEGDSQFMSRVNFEEQTLKRDILKRIHLAMNDNTAIGNTTEARWLLEKLDRERFGRGPAGGTDSGGAKKSQVTIYIPENGRDS